MNINHHARHQRSVRGSAIADRRRASHPIRRADPAPKSSVRRHQPRPPGLARLCLGSILFGVSLLLCPRSPACETAQIPRYVYLESTQIESDLLKTIPLIFLDFSDLLERPYAGTSDGKFWHNIPTLSIVNGVKSPFDSQLDHDGYRDFWTVGGDRSYPHNEGGEFRDYLTLKNRVFFEDIKSEINTPILNKFYPQNKSKEIQFFEHFSPAKMMEIPAEFTVFAGAPVPSGGERDSILSENNGAKTRRLFPRPNPGIFREKTGLDLGGKAGQIHVLPTVAKLAQERPHFPETAAIAAGGFTILISYLIYRIEISKRRSQQIRDIEGRLTREIRDRIDSETRFMAVAAGSLDALFIFAPLRDSEGKIRDLTCVYLNKNAELLTEKTADMAAGERLSNLLDRPFHVGLEAHIRAFETRTPLSGEFSLPLHDRPTPKCFQHQVVPLPNSLFVTIRDISHIKDQEEKFIKQIQQERLITEIENKIRNSLTLKDILNTTVAEVRKFLQADRVLVHGFREEIKQLARVESKDDAVSSMLGFVINDPSIFIADYLKYYQEGDAIAIPNLGDSQLSSTTSELLQFFQVRSLLIVPIPVPNLGAERTVAGTGDNLHNCLWGLLIVHQCSRERHWHPGEINLLKQLANQVGIAVRQSQLYEQAKQQMLREKTVNRITCAIRQTLDLQTLFSTATWEIGQHLQVDRVWIWQYQPKEQLWTNVSEYRKHLDLPPALHLQMSDKNNEIAARLKHFQGFSLYESRLCRTPASQKLAKKFPGAWSFLPLQFDGKLWGAIAIVMDYAWYDWEESQIEFLNQVATQLSVAIQQSELYEQLQTANRQLQQLACTDGLTGVANRRYFDIYFKQEWSRMAREKKPLSVILCDIDYFKQYNDTYGHQAGDACLQDVTRAMQGAVKRPADLIARYGGEEFVVVLPDTDIEGATRVATEIRSQLAACQIPHEASAVAPHVTLSMGVASIQLCRGVPPESLVAKADRALYRAKALGRDRIVLHRVEGELEITTIRPPEPAEGRDDRQNSA